MPRAESAVTINAPIEKVFDAIADPEKQIQYTPIAGVSNIKNKPGEKGKEDIKNTIPYYTCPHSKGMPIP